MAEYKWQPGQTVIWLGESGFNRVQDLRTVKRVTPSGRAVIGATQFDKHGREVTSSKWHRCFIEPATDKAKIWRIRQEALRSKAQNKVELAYRNKRFAALTRSQLERIIDILGENNHG